MKPLIITLAYAPAAVLRAGIARLYETATGDFEHVVVDQHYPFKREETLGALLELHARHRFRILDPGKNMGLHQGHNFVLENMQHPYSAVILYDPDSYPLTKGWDQAIVDVLQSGERFDIVGLIEPRGKQEMEDRGVAWAGTVSDQSVQEPVREGVISVAGYSARLLQASKGFQEVLPYYGGLEASMWAHMKVIGGRWGYLMDHDESLHMRDWADPDFVEYKEAHAGARTFAGTFEEWLAARA